MGKTRMEPFRYALEQSRCPVSYNGNLFSAADASVLVKEMAGQNGLFTGDERPERTKLAALMFGRGAVAAPWIFGETRKLFSALSSGAGEKEPMGSRMADDGLTDSLQSFQQFHDRLLNGYAEIMSGDRNTLFKMKELWYYFQCHFPRCEKELKKIKKAQKLSDYRSAVQAMFASGRFVEDGFTDK